MFAAGEWGAVEERLVSGAGVVVDGGCAVAVPGVGAVALRAGEPEPFVGLDIAEVRVPRLLAGEGAAVEVRRLPGLREAHAADPGGAGVEGVAGLQLDVHDALGHGVSVRRTHFGRSRSGCEAGKMRAGHRAGPLRRGIAVDHAQRMRRRPPLSPADERMPG